MWNLDRNKLPFEGDEIVYTEMSGLNYLYIHFKSGKKIQLSVSDPYRPTNFEECLEYNGVSWHDFVLSNITMSWSDYDNYKNECKNLERKKKLERILK